MRITQREMVEFLKDESPAFEFLHAFLKFRQEYYKDQLTSCLEESIPKVRAQWNAFEELTKEDGERLKLDMREFFKSLQPGSE